MQHMQGIFVHSLRESRSTGDGLQSMMKFSPGNARAAEALVLWCVEHIERGPRRELAFQLCGSQMMEEDQDDQRGLHLLLLTVDPLNWFVSKAGSSARHGKTLPSQCKSQRQRCEKDGGFVRHSPANFSIFSIFILHILSWSFMHLILDPSENIVTPVSRAQVLPDITNLQREAWGMKRHLLPSHDQPPIQSAEPHSAGLARIWQSSNTVCRKWSRCSSDPFWRAVLLLFGNVWYICVSFKTCQH